MKHALVMSRRNKLMVIPLLIPYYYRVKKYWYILTVIEGTLVNTGVVLSITVCEGANRGCPNNQLTKFDSNPFCLFVQTLNTGDRWFWNRVVVHSENIQARCPSSVFPIRCVPWYTGFASN
jgi:hypothetical protein